MGRLNRQRRAEKRRRRANQQATRDRPSSAANDSSPPLPVDEMIAIAAQATLSERADRYAEALRALERADAAPGGRGQIDRSLTATVARTTAVLFGDGWQPTELDHVVRRRLGAIGVDLIGADRSSVAGAGERAGMSWWAAVEKAIALIALLWTVPRLPPLAQRPTPTGVDEAILRRVRALLAKAESTEFPEEAESLTAKAQELMARYSIEHALVEGSGDGDGAAPCGRRLTIDDPYADEKSYLLAVVARANRCEAVWMDGVAMSTVIGFLTDLESTELLFTSLLVQATTALRVLGASAPPGARQRGRAFRRSFYLGYAGRIGERLKAATAAATDEAVIEHGDRLLPVLVSRERAVEEATEQMFPDTSNHKVRAYDRAGMVAGRLAADQARLAIGDELEASA